MLPLGCQSYLILQCFTTLVQTGLKLLRRLEHSQSQSSSNLADPHLCHNLCTEIMSPTDKHK